MAAAAGVLVLVVRDTLSEGEPRRTEVGVCGVGGWSVPRRAEARKGEDEGPPPPRTGEAADEEEGDPNMDGVGRVFGDDRAGELSDGIELERTRAGA